MRGRVIHRDVKRLRVAHHREGEHYVRAPWSVRLPYHLNPPLRRSRTEHGAETRHGRAARTRTTHWRGMSYAVGVLLAVLLVAGALVRWLPEGGVEEVPRPAGPSVAPPTGSPVFDGLASGWTNLPAPPEVRNRAAMAWTGQELLVWSGYVFTGGGDKPVEADGFVFDARAQSWEQMAASPLAPRAYPASAWTGDELLIWGGADGRREQFFDDGAAYDPRADSWRLLPQAPIEARAPLFVWTGHELIVWGTAVRVDHRPRDGAAYDPLTNSWRKIATSPIELTDATAVWTGREMIVFGAALHGGNFPESKTAIGAAYDPKSDTWRELPKSELSPQASTAAWNGREVIAWDYLNATEAYDPRANSWRQLPDVPLRAGECVPESVSIEGHIFGTYCGQLALYEPAADRWRDISRRELFGSGFELVAAPPAVLLLSRNVDTDEEQMLAYRP